MELEIDLGCQRRRDNVRTGEDQTGRHEAGARAASETRDPVVARSASWLSALVPASAPLVGGGGGSSSRLLSSATLMDALPPPLHEQRRQLPGLDGDLDAELQ